MPLGYNRKYNSLCGLPVNVAQLSGTAPVRGGAAAYGSRNRICVIEDVPKTGAGLATGDQAQEYIVDFGPNVWQLRVYANGSAISSGHSLTHVISGVDSTHTGSVKVGDLTNAGTAITGVTLAALDDEHLPMVLDTTGTIADGNHGDAYVMIGI